MLFAVFFIGLALGSFVNALVWRVYKQEFSKKSSRAKKYSIINGRSMCPHCEHELAAKDLVPVFSWLSLRGRCRYCHKPISAQYPIVELATATAFLGFLLFAPETLVSGNPFVAAIYLLLIVGLMALFVFDLKWMYLPFRIVDPLIALAIVLRLYLFVDSGFDSQVIISSLLGVLVLGGLFQLLYFVSKSRWIGGGDVRLGVLIGILLGPILSYLVLLLSSLFGSVIILGLMALGKVKHSQKVPFGPFLVASTYIVILWGERVVDWYSQQFLGGLL
jgi:prepilin signal peptidase PulO-like enzyme (type II secretory pathway)